MKTAISLPDEIYERATRKAAELGISRSEFMARAARSYLDQLAARSLTRQMPPRSQRLADDSPVTMIRPPDALGAGAGSSCKRESRRVTGCGSGADRAAAGSASPAQSGTYRPQATMNTIRFQSMDAPALGLFCVAPTIPASSQNEPRWLFSKV
jgi:hypothetical protein